MQHLSGEDAQFLHLETVKQLDASPIPLDISTDRRIMPDVSFFRECLTDAIQELLEVAHNAPAESPHTQTAGKGPR